MSDSPERSAVEHPKSEWHACVGPLLRPARANIANAGDFEPCVLTRLRAAHLLAQRGAR